MEVTSVAVGIASVVAIVVFIYAGAHIAIALGMISFVGVVLLKGNLDIALNLLALAMADSIADEAFAWLDAPVRRVARRIGAAEAQSREPEEEGWVGWRRGGLAAERAPRGQPRVRCSDPSLIA